MKVEEAEETLISIFVFFITFSESSIVVPDKIYKVPTKFFITMTGEVKFAFIQMDFRVDVAMTHQMRNSDS